MNTSDLASDRVFAEVLQPAFGRCIVLHDDPPLIENQDPRRVVTVLVVLELLMEGPCSETCPQVRDDSAHEGEFASLEVRTSLLPAEA